MCEMGDEDDGAGHEWEIAKGPSELIEWGDAGGRDADRKIAEGHCGKWYISANFRRGEHLF